MKLAHPALSAPLSWERTAAVTLTAESPAQFRVMALDLLRMAEGTAGDFILSENGAPVPFSRIAEVISDPLRVDPSSNRRLMTALLKEAAAVATHELPERLTDLYRELADVMDAVIHAMRQDLTYTEACDPLAFIKLCDLKPDADGLELPELLLLYMELCDRYLKKELFVLFHARSCLSERERASLCRDAAYREWKLLFLESGPGVAAEEEIVRILDEDLCEP